MHTCTFPALDREVSAIGLGTWQLGAEWGAVSDQRAGDILRAAWDAGIDFFDTADVYGRGRSERRIGRFLRETGARPTVVTKLGRFPDPGWPHNFRSATVRRHVEASLGRLGVDVLDLVQLHCVPLAELESGRMFDALRAVRDAGLIRAWGASVESPREAELCLRQPDCASLQVIYNLFWQEPAARFFDRARAQGTALIVRLPLASGLLSGRFDRNTTFAADDHRHFNRDGAAFHVGETFSGLPFETGLELVAELRELAPAGVSLADFAQRFVLDHLAVTTVITGATRVAQVRANAAVASMPELPRALHHRLEAFARERVHPHVRGHGR